MNFLHPWALALAGLALVPLVLHLVRRDTRRRVAFPALRYLRSAERQSARSMKVRDRLLAATRIALVVGIAALAGRPLVGRGDATSHPPTDLVLVIDNTASMARLAGDGPMLDAALEAAAVTLERAGPEDRVWIASVVDGLAIAGGSATEAAAVLASLRSSDAAGSVTETVERIVPMVPAVEGRARELQLITDFQAGSMSGFPELAGSWSTLGLRLRPDSPVNGAVTGLRIGPTTPIPPGGVLTVAAELVRWPSEDDAAGDGSAEPPDVGVDVRLLLDGRTAAVRGADWGTDVIFSLPAPDPGPHVLRVEVDPSGLRSDDGRQAGFRVADVPRVALDAPPGPEGTFLARALETLEADGRIERAVPGTAEVEIRIGGGPRIARSRGAPAEPSLILVPPLELTSLPAFNQRLNALGVPWRAVPDPTPGTLRLAEADLPGLRESVVRYRLLLRPAPAPTTEIDSVLLRTEDGEPWLVRGRTSGASTFLLLGSPIHPDATGLPVSAAMVEFADALVGRWARPGEPPTHRVAGETFALPPRADSLAGPIGPAEPVEGGAPWTPRRAGTWRLVVGTDRGPEDRYLGVNVAATESDPSPADVSGGRTGPAGLQVIESPEDWRDSVFATRRGADARPALLAALLLLLVLEGALAAPRRHSGATPVVAETDA